MTTCCGDFEAATALVAEHDAVKEVTGIRMAPYGARLLAAYQGRPADLPTQLSATDEELVENAGMDTPCRSPAWRARSSTTVSAGTPMPSPRRGEIAYEISFLAPFALSELIEAAAKTGDLEAARDALDSSWR